MINVDINLGKACNNSCVFSSNGQTTSDERRWAKVEQIETEHDRKIKDVEEKIAENERAMEDAKRTEEAPTATGGNPDEDPGIVTTDDPPEETDPEDDMADAGDDPMADDEPPADPIRD